MALLSARGVSFGYGAAAVLHDVDLAVGEGDRVAVVGPNGAGKSTLLCLMAGLIEPDAGSVSATGTVGLLPQERDLRPAETIRQYLARRTGTAAAESAMLAASERLADGGRAAGREYSAALDRYLALGGPELETRAAAVLSLLGLPAELGRQTHALSGGQAARLALAAALLARFDVLMLDEPTNDLDLSGLELLEGHLAERRGGLVVVSHDRAFLERTASQVLQLDKPTHRAALYRGGYQAYRTELDRDKAHAREAFEAYALRRDDLIERARRQKEWARSGERAANSAAARRKEPDRNIRRGRAHAAQQLGAAAAAAIKAAERLEPVAEPRKEWELRLQLGAASRSGDIAAVLSDAVIERGAFRLGPVSLQLTWGDRVAVHGENGSGKSTLLQAMLGQLPLRSGRAWLGASVRAGEIGQARRTFDPDAPLLAAFRSYTGQPAADARTLLAKFGLGADHVGRPVASLSPGERTRTDLALLMHAGANLLVLDEPTNHLDVPAIEQLELALDGYQGTLLLVTHDRRFAEQVRVTRRLTIRAGQVTEH